MFKVICVDHVGIACKDLDVSKKFYTEVLGLECTGEEPVPEQGVKTVFIPCGETLLELLVDITENNDGPIGKYIAKNGQASSTLLSVLTTSKLLSPAYRKRRHHD